MAVPDLSVATAKVLETITSAQAERFTDNETAQYIRTDWSRAAERVVDGSGYIVKGSAGQSKWAETVWLSVFDPMVTTSAQRGYYVVYLVSSDGSKCFLSIAHAITEVRDEQAGNARELLAGKVNSDIALLGTRLDLLDTGKIDLNATSSRSRDYEVAVVTSIEYRAGEFPPEGQFHKDLKQFLGLYTSLIELRDAVQDEVDTPPDFSGPQTYFEAKKYRWHRRAERNQGLAKKAKAFHGTTCQVQSCGKTMSEIYGDDVGTYIEAHHLTPFAELLGRPTELDPETDFAVVCPDCHRMLHRRTPPFTLDELNAMMNQAEATAGKKGEVA